jgi:HSP20 family protein
MMDFPNDIMNSVMEQVAQNVARQRPPVQSYTIPVDLVEHGDGYTLYAVVPGMQSDDICVDFSDGVLTIKAESKPSELPEGMRYHLRERRYGTYERSFRFPVQLNAEAIEATYEAGILTLNLPKAQTVKAHRIKVQTGQ